MLCSAVYRTTPDCSRVFYTPYLAFIAAPCLSLIWLQTNKPQEKLYNTVAQHSTAGKELVCTGNLLHRERKREDDRYYRSCQEKQHFLKGNKYQEDCNQTFMEDKTDAQTRKHMIIFFTDAFVSYLQDYVKCKYSQIFGWSIHWQKSFVFLSPAWASSTKAGVQSTGFWFWTTKSTTSNWGAENKSPYHYM